MNQKEYFDITRYLDICSLWSQIHFFMNLKVQLFLEQECVIFLETDWSRVINVFFFKNIISLS